MKLNKEYRELSENILNEEHFEVLKNEVHHGTNRYDHCKRVAHLSFIMAKLFKGNTKTVTRAGLLHDFFLGNHKSNPDASYINHPKVSAQNAKKYFNLSETEQEAIETHMYHYMLVKNTFSLKKDDIKKYKPKSKEGKIVCASDLLVSIFECLFFGAKYATGVYFLFIFNLIRY